jgi:hypothetical protein
LTDGSSGGDDNTNECASATAYHSSAYQSEKAIRDSQLEAVLAEGVDHTISGFMAEHSPPTCETETMLFAKVDGERIRYDLSKPENMVYFTFVTSTAGIDTDTSTDDAAVTPVAPSFMVLWTEDIQTSMGMAQADTEVILLEGLFATCPTDADFEGACADGSCCAGDDFSFRFPNLFYVPYSSECSTATLDFEKDSDGQPMGFSQREAMMNQTINENDVITLPAMNVMSEPAGCQLKHYLYIEVQG